MALFAAVELHRSDRAHTRALVGIWQSYRFFVTDQIFGTVVFDVPVIEILLILASSYIATPFTTYLPSRAAAQVAPSEALRHE